MSVMVEAQDAVIDEVEHNAVKTELDTEKGLTHVKEAVVHARNYRKWRWLCFGLSLIILVRRLLRFLSSLPFTLRACH